MAQKTDPGSLPNIEEILKSLQKQHGYNITFSKKFIEKWEEIKAHGVDNVQKYGCFINDACIACDTRDLCDKCDTLDWCVTSDTQ